MIRGFADKRTTKVFKREQVRDLSNDLQRAALRNMLQINAAVELDDLRTPPGNRLQALKGNRAGQYSLRINDQFRICFIWKDGDAYDVVIVDYH